MFCNMDVRHLKGMWVSLPKGKREAVLYYMCIIKIIFLRKFSLTLFLSNQVKFPYTQKTALCRLTQFQDL